MDITQEIDENDMDQVFYAACGALQGVEACRDCSKTLRQTCWTIRANLGVFECAPYHDAPCLGVKWCSEALPQTYGRVRKLLGEAIRLLKLLDTGFIY